MRQTEADIMAFFQNILLRNKHVDTDMEAGNHSNVELNTWNQAAGLPTMLILSTPTACLWILNQLFHDHSLHQIPCLYQPYQKQHSHYYYQPKLVANSWTWTENTHITTTESAARFKWWNKDWKYPQKYVSISLKTLKFNRMGFRERLESDIRWHLNDQYWSIKRWWTNN